MTVEVLHGPEERAARTNNWQSPGKNKRFRIRFHKLRSSDILTSDRRFCKRPCTGIEGAGSSKEKACQLQQDPKTQLVQRRGSSEAIVERTHTALCRHRILPLRPQLEVFSRGHVRAEQFAVFLQSARCPKSSFARGKGEVGDAKHKEKLAARFT